MFTKITEPQSMSDALAGDLSNHWKQASDFEYDPLLQNEMWYVAELPSSKQVFKVKYGMEQFKACLVAKGYAQDTVLIYDETFSPVVRFQSIRVLIALAVQNDMLLHQMDVVTAFLNGTLEEESTCSSQMDMINKERNNLFAS